MRIGSIIAEYNPFHNGHKYQIDQYKKIDKCTHLVAIMSGNFVQRGGPALIDKFTRAKIAIENGVDLVIELPSMYATQTAELFARGAVCSLDSLNCIDSLCYGSELGQINKIKAIADLLVRDKDVFEERLNKILEEEKSYAKAREKALIEILNYVNNESIMIDEDFLRAPNNILAIEYEKELMRIQSKINSMTIIRKDSNHNDDSIGNSISSASAVRNFLCKDVYSSLLSNSQKIDILKNNINIISKNICSETYNEIVKLLENDIIPLNENEFFDYICLNVVREEDKLNSFFEVKEGLENSIRKNIIYSKNMEQLLDSLVSKRYSRAKIRRSLFNILLNLQKDEMEKVKHIKKVPYIRILAFNDRGREILKKIKYNSDVKIIMSPAKAKKVKYYEENIVYKMLLDFDLRSSNIYYQKYFALNRDCFCKGEPDYISLIKKI